MEFLHWVILILALFLGLGIFIITNLNKKVEIAEEMIIKYSDYINKISTVVDISNEKLKKLDERGVFNNDDEVGFFFNQLKIIQNILNEFIVKEY